ncbi:hypothetical protein M514_08427, partial [Trichuris suis]
LPSVVSKRVNGSSLAWSFWYIAPDLLDIRKSALRTHCTHGFVSEEEVQTILSRILVLRFHPDSAKSIHGLLFELHENVLKRKHEAEQNEKASRQCAPRQEGQAAGIYQNLRNNFEKRMTLPRMVTERSKTLDKGIIASYEISQLIAKTGNCHNIGESLILPAVSTVISAMTTINAREILQSIPLSNSTVSRRTNGMAEDIEEQLVCLLRPKSFLCCSTKLFCKTTMLYLWLMCDSGMGPS